MDTNSEFLASEINPIVGLLLDLGDVAELTLGQGGTGSEDKRRRYN